MKTRPSVEEHYKLPNPGLRAYFRRTVDGNLDDYRPPFWKGKSRETVLAMWQAELERSDVQSKYPSLYEYEMEMKAKVGPMSIQKPLADRISDIEAYYEDVKSKSVPIPGRALLATIQWAKAIKGIRLRSIPRTIENMRLNTNSGSPFFTKRKREAKWTMEGRMDFYTIGDKAYIRIPLLTYTLTATLGWRGQEGGPNPADVKQRVIWMMPFSVNVRELQLYQPAIEAVQKQKLIPAYVSMDYVDQEVTALFDSKGVDDFVICTDFSRFDQHFNDHMQEAARVVLESVVTPSREMDDWMGSIFPIKYNIPLVCSEELMFTGKHGMGSGSGGTNFDECLAHKALQFEAALSKNQTLNPHSMAYGDDGILTYPGIAVEDVIRTYESHGQVMNPEKQYVSKHDCVVLRRWHSTQYRVNGTMVGVYSTFRALGRLLAQERFYDPEEWGPEQVTLRAWSILENCNNSPYFEEFVQFCMKGDKYRLGLDLPGFMDRAETIAKRSIDQLPDFLGYTKTIQDKDPSKGITNWKVYKYLKTLK
nr:RNA-dependent RNA polymerase [Marmot picobirnavirus]